MKHLRKIQKVRGSSVEALTWFEDMNETEQTCVRRNILPIMVTCEGISGDINCPYRLARTRECLYRFSQDDYKNVPVELVRALKDLRR